MKKINYIAVCFLIVMFAFTIIIDCSLKTKADDDREYLVDINRTVNDINNGEKIEDIVKKYKAITSIIIVNDIKTDEAGKEFFSATQNDYVIRIINNKYYRINYKVIKNNHLKSLKATINIVVLSITVFIIIILFYVKHKILKPFNSVRDLPVELSKGNITNDIKETKGKQFGKFVWGLNILREKLESEKQSQLNLQKEKKTLVLSVSHDIKTPLSAIKLYSQALMHDLYPEEEKKKEIAGIINAKADEINNYVSQIIEATHKDFLVLEVKDSEFYITDLIENIKSHYVEKFDINRTKFVVSECNQCLLNGDFDRAVEVMQNILENAIKYGDGKKVTVTFEREENCQLINITDTGCTLEEGETEHIFESFWRGSNTGNQKGNGLGLYICKELMHKMKGDIFATVKDNKMTVTLVFMLK